MNKKVFICNIVYMIIFLVFSLCLEGCGEFLDKPALKITNYILEYDPPVINSGRQMLPVHLKIERFASAPEYRTKKIIYRDEANIRNNYNYHSWTAYPSDIVGYFLLRDFSRSGLFKAVTNFTDTNISPTYVVDGILEEFYEKDETDIRMAVVSINIIMTYDKEADVIKRTVLQKNYKTETQYTENTPKSLVVAMSESVESISRRIMEDIYTALAADF